MSIPDDLPREDWERIDAIFLGALERPIAERAAFLDRACEGDAELRRVVEGLLAAAARLDDDADEPRLAVGDEVIEAISRELERDPLGPGVRVGPYRLVEELGRGGSGVVFLAERDDGEYRQKVALKVLRRGLDTDELLARFRVERQILASLSHPNIARLLDGGAVEDGRPFLVLEYVDGEPITAYCDRHGLTVPERLRLFLVVADALRHAHRNLIVHRDLKPSNILVRADGTVKLVDFGIAKLLDHAAVPGGAPATRTEIRLLTPEYATPEQVRGEPITTATDIYQLGILLYELLTGRHPHSPGAAGIASLERAICETDPPPPSAAVARMAAEDGERVAARRGTTPRRLRTALAGDLDTIVLEALRKEPERRYPSVEHLAEDVERHRAGRPVLARPETWGYRARKFVARHPVTVGAALVVGLLLLGYVVTVSVYADRLGRERDRARLEAEKAEQVAGFLVDIFQVSSPGSERGDTVSARTLLERGAERIEASSEGDPALRARMLEVVGTVYLQLGTYDRAEALLEASLEARRALHGDEHADIAASLRKLALLRQRQGRLDEAAELAVRTLDLERRLAGPDHERTGRAAGALALVLHHQGRYDEAEAHYREALEIARQTSPHDEAELTGLLNSLGSLLRDRGDYRAALPVLRESVRVREELLGPDHLQTAVSLTNLGVLYQNLGELNEAADALRRALEIRRRQLGEDHPDVAFGMSNLATTLRRMGEYAEAEALGREGLALRERTLGALHPEVGSAHYNLAETLRRAGRPADAEPHYRRALEVLRSALGDRHPNVATVMGGLAENLRVLGRTGEAAGYLEQALALRREALGDRHPRLASSLLVLALLQRDQGEIGRALASAGEAAEIRRERLGERHADYGIALMTLGSVHLEAADAGEAERVLREALGILESSDGVEARLVADARVALADALLRRGELEEARREAEAGLAAIEEALGATHPRLRKALDVIAGAHDAAGRHEEAERVRRRLAGLRDAP